MAKLGRAGADGREGKRCLSVKEHLVELHVHAVPS